MPTPDNRRVGHPSIVQGCDEDPFLSAAMSSAPKRTIRDEDVTAGLDQLEGGYPRPVRGFRWATLLGPLASVGGLLLVWQLLVWARVQPVWVLPPLREIGSALWRCMITGEAAEAMWTSLRRGATGFVIALLLGTAVGLAVGRVRWLRVCFSPLLSAMQSLPSVAWVPFAVMLFYLTDTTIYMVILLSAVPSIAMGLISGLDQVPPLLTRVGQTLGAGRWQLVRYVLLPAALPTYLSGMKQGWAFAWRSLMAAELIVTSPNMGFGLGTMLNQAQSNSDMPSVMAALIFVLCVGLVVELAVFGPLERHILARRGMHPSGG